MWTRSEFLIVAVQIDTHLDLSIRICIVSTCNLIYSHLTHIWPTCETFATLLHCMYTGTMIEKIFTCKTLIEKTFLHI